MSKLKHAVIGFGFISEKHMNGYGALKDEVETVAMCDILEDRRNFAKETYGIRQVYKDYHELLKDPDIDIVSVCVPNYLHKQITVDALRAGKNVHCEKPMAMNYEEAQEMLQVQRETGKNLIIGLNNRFVPVTQYVRDYIRRGKLGDVYYIRSSWLTKIGFPPAGWYTDRTLSGGGAIIDIGVHYIDLAMSMLDYPEVVSVYGQTFDRIMQDPEIRSKYCVMKGMMPEGFTYNVDDMASGTIKLEGGKAIDFSVTWATNIEGDKESYEIYGTKGGIKYEGTGGGDGKVRIYEVDENGNGIIIQPAEAEVAPYGEITEFRLMTDAVKNNRDIRYIPEQAAVTSRIIDAVKESSRTGRSVDFRK